MTARRAGLLAAPLTPLALVAITALAEEPKATRSARHRRRHTIVRLTRRQGDEGVSIVAWTRLETVHPNKPVGCLARRPAPSPRSCFRRGKAVTIEHDQQRSDRHSLRLRREGRWQEGLVANKEIILQGWLLLRQVPLRQGEDGGLSAAEKGRPMMPPRPLGRRAGGGEDREGQGQGEGVLTRNPSSTSPRAAPSITPRLPPPVQNPRSRRRHEARKGYGPCLVQTAPVTRSFSTTGAKKARDGVTTRGGTGRQGDRMSVTSEADIEYDSLGTERGESSPRPGTGLWPGKDTATIRPR